MEKISQLGVGVCTLQDYAHTQGSAVGWGNNKEREAGTEGAAMVADRGHPRRGAPLRSLPSGGRVRLSGGMLLILGKGCSRHTSDCGKQHGQQQKNHHAESQGCREAVRGVKPLQCGLHLGIGRATCALLHRFHHEISKLLLSVEEDNADDREQRRNCEGNGSRFGAEPGGGSGGQFSSHGLSMEPCRQDAGEYHPHAEGDEVGSHSYQSRLQGGAEDGALERSACGWAIRRIAGGFGFGRDVEIRERRLGSDFDPHLRGAALRTEGSAVLDRGAAFFAGVFHRLKLAQTLGESKSGRRPAVSTRYPVASALLSGYLVLGTVFLDRVVLAVGADVDQGELGVIAARLDGHDVLVVLGPHLQLDRVSLVIVRTRHGLRAAFVV